MTMSLVCDRPVDLEKFVGRTAVDDLSGRLRNAAVADVIGSDASEADR
jgi:hypothetical protein